MPCHYPLVAWRSRDEEDFNPATQKSRLVFDPNRGWPKTRMEIKCGQCAGCRLDRARQWAIRCVHEASLHNENCFLTLTYNDDYLPTDGSLDKRHIQLFLKRLRRRYDGNCIRFFQCGEYGDTLSRPHHHCLLFGFNFPDRQIIRSGKTSLYISEELSNLWPYGYHSIGDLTFDSACYTARYILKKINGDIADDHYNGRQPEYITMSRRPGIGKGWYDLYKNDLYNYDQCVVKNSFIAKPPSYYDKIFEREHIDQYTKIKNKRRENAKLNPENTDERRSVKAEIQQIKQDRVKRSYETTQTSLLGSAASRITAKNQAGAEPPVGPGSIGPE